MVERGAKVVLIRPAPVPGPPRLAVVRPPRVRPLLGEGGRARRPGGDAFVGQRLRALHQRLAGQRQRDAALRARRPSACSRPGGRSRTRCPPWCATAHCPASRRLKVAVVENGSSWVEPLLKNLADVYKKMPQDFARGPGRGHQAQHLHQPVLGGGPRRAGRADRRRPRPVRVGLPAPRGPGRPGELRRGAGRPARRDGAQDHGRQPGPPDERRRHRRPVTDGARSGERATVPRIIASTAERFGDRTAVVEDGRRLTYRELCRSLATVRCRAGRLGRRAGRPGRDLGVQLHRVDRGRPGPVPGRRGAGPGQHPVQGGRGSRRSPAEPGPGPGDRHRFPRHRLRGHAGGDRRSNFPTWRRWWSARGPAVEGTVSWDQFMARATGVELAEVERRAAAVEPRRSLRHPVHLGHDRRAQRCGPDPRPDRCGWPPTGWP